MIQGLEITSLIIYKVRNQVIKDEEYNVFHLINHPIPLQV